MADLVECEKSCFNILPSKTVILNLKTQLHSVNACRNTALELITLGKHRLGGPDGPPGPVLRKRSPPDRKSGMLRRRNGPSKTFGLKKNLNHCHVFANNVF